MKAAYVKAMDALYVLCIVIAGISMVVMTLVIPYGVFMRYVFNAAAAWPEPLSVLLMILFSFFGGAACYRANSHMSVAMFTDAVPDNWRAFLVWLVDLCMAALALFTVIWGVGLVKTIWHQVVGEFPFLSVGFTYLPIPLGGAITMLFILERVWIGPPPPDSIVYREPASAD